MKITILNGNPNAHNHGFETYLAQLSQILTAEQHQVTQVNIRDLQISYCIGCFGCWVKKPGECVTADRVLHRVPGDDAIGFHLMGCAA